MIRVSNEYDTASTPSTLSSSSVSASTRMNEVPLAIAAINKIKNEIVEAVRSCWWIKLKFLVPL